MFVSHLNNNQINSENVEITNHSEIAEQFEEAIVDQESSKATKDLPDVFSLSAAKAKASSSKSEIPSDIKKGGYFESIEFEVYEDTEAVQLNSYYYDHYGDLRKPLFVWTLLKATNGSFEGLSEGTQEIYYNKKLISTSTEITYVFINGEPTVQHWHKHFCVETNRFGQRLIYLK